MTQTLNIRIESDKTSVENSQLLDTLRLALERETEIECTKETIPAPKDTQSLSLTTILTLAITSAPLIQIAFNVITYQINKMRHCSITVTKTMPNGDKVEIKKEKLTVAELKKELELIQTDNPDELSIVIHE